MCAEALRGNNEQFIELAKAQFEQLQLGAKHDLDSRQKAVENLADRSRIHGAGRWRGKDARKSPPPGRRFADRAARRRSRTRTKASCGDWQPCHRSPSSVSSGRFGEMQLENTVESAGMLAYCDFVAQLTGHGDEDRILRPDLVVRLPGGRTVLVDAKSPIQALHPALRRRDGRRAGMLSALRQFGRDVKHHIDAMQAKYFRSRIRGHL